MLAQSRINPIPSHSQINQVVPKVSNMEERQSMAVRYIKWMSSVSLYLAQVKCSVKYVTEKVLQNSGVKLKDCFLYRGIQDFFFFFFFSPESGRDM